MKTRIVRNITRVTLFAAMVLAVCLFGSPANAQSDFQGKFTLPHETHWGQAALPAGDYMITFTHDNTPQPMLVIRDAKSRLIVGYESLNIRENGTKGESALLISTRGTEWVVYSLRIAELGESFVYERPPGHERAEQEARKTQVIPVIVAKK